MNILTLGGDGFIGWAASLHLARYGHAVTILDDGSRRQIDRELGIQSLTPIADLADRVVAWNRYRAHQEGPLDYIHADACNYDDLWAHLHARRPEAVLHCAEQRAAPYSMKSPAHKRYTVDRNVSATHNLLCALVELELDAHVVHIGSMGVYGYGMKGAQQGQERTSTVPEGYVRAWLGGDRDSALHVGRILHPARPGSVYHLTKCLDQLLFEFYARNDGIRVTDLHQGIVWGTETDETKRDPALVNRFDYDGDYGTVLNRFLVQAAVGYPLTVHGTGGQTRAFIHIRDSAECIRLAIENPPTRGDRPTIRNQMTECHRLRDLAALIAERTGAEIAYTPNPRKEDAENELMVANDSLLGLGLEPTTLADGLLDEIRETAGRYRDRVDPDAIPCRSVWTREQEAGEVPEMETAGDD